MPPSPQSSTALPRLSASSSFNDSRRPQSHPLLFLIGTLLRTPNSSPRTPSSQAGLTYWADRSTHPRLFSSPLLSSSTSPSPYGMTQPPAPPSPPSVLPPPLPLAPPAPSGVVSPFSYFYQGIQLLLPAQLSAYAIQLILPGLIDVIGRLGQIKERRTTTFL
ncbi:hypothetical protein MLD38_018702 [Melastoma candidum]|uniref:Uncharacterized protein n=1 Tax=Melastoma candidum TaxID=119954 RepID=A0ACB9QY56_9MYRT|nr:hypothetical protein MLD38_018702 [Melastoma candidum]